MVGSGPSQSRTEAEGEVYAVVKAVPFQRNSSIHSRLMVRVALGWSVRFVARVVHGDRCIIVFWVSAGTNLH